LDEAQRRAIAAMATFESAEFKERESRFIVGVFNYCDRWCEKCRFNDRCRVYDSERAMRERHEILGEDPDDPAVWMQDVQNTFQETFDLLQEMADEAGVDLDDLPESLPIKNPIRDESFDPPLLARTKELMGKVDPLLDRVREEIPQLGEQLGNSLFREEDEAKVEARGQEIITAVQSVRDAYELLCQYRFFIVVKMTRALHALEEAEE
jgi:hypothetical protein